MASPVTKTGYQQISPERRTESLLFPPWISVLQNRSSTEHSSISKSFAPMGILTRFVEFGKRNTDIGVARTHRIALGEIFGTMYLDLQNPNSSGPDTGFSA